MTWTSWPPALWLVINTLAVYRLTRLVVKDSVLARPRRWLDDLDTQKDGRPFERDPEADPTRGRRRAKVQVTSANAAYRFATAIVACPWCLAVWIAAVVIALTWAIPSIWAYPAFGLALAAGTGWLADREL